MSLFIPSANFSGASDNMPSTVTSSATPGTSITAGTSNAIGSAVSLVSALAYDCQMITIYVSGFSIVGAISRCLMDILYDPAGGTSWTVLIPNLLVGGTNSPSTAFTWCRSYTFPLWIPAGASIGGQVRGSNATATSGLVSVMCVGGINNASWWCGQKVIDVGVTAASSAGTSHTPGSTGAYSAWASLGSALTYDAGAVQLGVQNAVATVNAQQGMYFEVGISSTILAPPTFYMSNTSEIAVCLPPGPFFCQIPNGSQLQVRGKASGTGQATDVAAYVTV